ncbi:ATP-dependent Clp protease proteolytic subunit [Proteiniclasticum sp. SCR006]|uniref:ATP-dependent Clp protease proteolytic subunit n=1 Tax=Proteiniclasticum aestuarii TaxID=2817862 RepID=A0A939H7J9_9CLOT|nr:NfeD family protein [Proteiniclasticum aestuarii]MBO1263463.1 ATP-dependent Clp protease proteolytic subunit [Proteiniclasticum aestuarii]
MKRVLKTMIMTVLMFSMFLTTVMAMDVWEVRFNGEVSPSQSRWLANAYQEAEENQADAVYLILDTLGGRVDSALEMSKTISSMDTIVLVDGGAISAGALMALSGSEMYMTAGSTIGGAEPQIGGERADEKTVSVWSAELASQAEKNGRDPLIARAMADDAIVIEGLVEEGKLLTLTAEEALKYEMTDGIYRSELDLRADKNLNIIGSSGKTTINYVTDFLTTAAVSTVLLMIGIAGILIELFTPGFGIPGGIGIAALGLYFGGGILAGISGWEAALLFIIGLALLLVEVFIIPGFGIAGVLGLAALFGSIFLSTPDPSTAVQSLVIAIIGAAVLIFIVFRFTPGRKVFKRLVLDMEETPEKGYVAAKQGLASLIGKQGIAKTTLRPSGTAEFDDAFVDVVTSGEYIEEGTPIIVTNVEGMRVIVKQTKGVDVGAD